MRPAPRRLPREAHSVARKKGSSVGGGACQIWCSALETLGITALELFDRVLDVINGDRGIPTEAVGIGTDVFPDPFIVDSEAGLLKARIPSAHIDWPLATDTTPRR